MLIVILAINQLRTFTIVMNTVQLIGSVILVASIAAAHHQSKINTDWDGQYQQNTQGKQSL